MKNKKIIVFISVIIIFIPIIVLAINNNIFSDIGAFFGGKNQKNTQMPKEMQEIKAELENIDTNIEKDTEVLENDKEKLSNSALDEKIRKMDEKIEIINKKEGINTQAIKNDINAKLKTPIKDEKIVKQLKEVDKNMLEVGKNMNNLNIKGE